MVIAIALFLTMVQAELYAAALRIGYETESPRRSSLMIVRYRGGNPGCVGSQCPELLEVSYELRLN